MSFKGLCFSPSLANMMVRRFVFSSVRVKSNSGRFHYEIRCANLYFETGRTLQFDGEAVHFRGSESHVALSYCIDTRNTTRKW